MSEITTWWICSDCDYPNEKDNVPCDNCSAYYDKLVPWIKRSELEKLQQENAEMREAFKELNLLFIESNVICFQEGKNWRNKYSHLLEKLK